MSENPRLFALFIDGDNVQAALVPKILNILSEFGKPIIRKVFLNKTTPDWENSSRKHSLKLEVITNNTKGKNASDIALVIEAMDKLFNRKDLDGFCIVSSDSDFTGL